MVDLVHLLICRLILYLIDISHCTQSGVEESFDQGTHRTNQREKHLDSFYLKSNVFLSIIQQSLNLQICLFYTYSFKMYMPTKII